MLVCEQWYQAEELSEKLSESYQKIIPANRATLFYQNISADYALRCIGHSMEPTFYPGELVFIHEQETFRDGQICRVMIDGKHTLKRVYRINAGFRLVADNKLYQPFDITGIDAEKVKIVGIAIARR